MMCQCVQVRMPVVAEHALDLVAQEHHDAVIRDRLYQLDAFVWRNVFQECFRVIGSGDAAGQIEIGATEESRSVLRGSRSDAVRRNFRGDELVDLLGRPLRVAHACSHRWHVLFASVTDTSRMVVVMLLEAGRDRFD